MSTMQRTTLEMHQHVLKFILLQLVLSAFIACASAWPSIELPKLSYDYLNLHAGEFTVHIITFI